MDYRYTRGVLLSVFIHRIIDDKFVYSYDAFGTYKARLHCRRLHIRIIF